MSWHMAYVKLRSDLIVFFLSENNKDFFKRFGLWAHKTFKKWWRHQIETFSPLLTICAGNSPVTGEFPAQRPVTRSFGVFFDLRLNKRLSRQSWGWWFETPSRPLWRHCNEWALGPSVRPSWMVKLVTYDTMVRKRWWGFRSPIMFDNLKVTSMGHP